MTFPNRLAQSFRLTLFDKRGTGLSDHGGQFAALETRMEDLHAVLETAGSTRTVLLASHEGCSMAVLYAATYPERTRALILFHPLAYEPGRQSEQWRARLAELRERWGTRELSDQMLEDITPSLHSNPANRDWFASWLRVGATPAAAYASTARGSRPTSGRFCRQSVCLRSFCTGRSAAAGMRSGTPAR